MGTASMGEQENVPKSWLGDRCLKAAEEIGGRANGKIVFQDEQDTTTREPAK